MPVVHHTPDEPLHLPQDFLQRRQLPADMNFWLDEREGDLILRPRLPDAEKLYIEPTTACNLECRTCIRHAWEDPQAMMNRATFDKIIVSLPGLPKLNRVIFTSFGEPLTHPGLMDMIAAVRRANIEVTVGTNGLLLNADVSRELIRLGVDRIMVSIDGGKPETYEGVRGALLSQVIENIERFNALKHEMNALFPAVGVEFVIMRSNFGELDDITRLAMRLNVSRILVSNVLPYAADMQHETLYSHQPVEPFKTTSWALRAGAWVMWATLELPRMHWGAERRCRFIKDKAMAIGWDGGVSPCYALSHNYHYHAIDGCRKQVQRYVLGNVNQTPLDEIWMTEEYMRFRAEVGVFHFPSCPDCDLRDTCDLRKDNEGCWGLNPSCADCLWAQDIIRCP
ncbi:MAG TPA: tungsten cofactor oxidoreductase radical SAM maturase [Anaerolineaceae bacterium]|nr:tungsten cofactor oxidoreductase radical SAM maturase [Anaerolineaceae bacterium]HPN50491.1 tungsten cofactor oxidoreductase radical SAM maturase [Anaerolineaceae bacterium]